MTLANDASPDRSALVYRYHERLYRLALLVAGDVDAADALVQRAYRTLPTNLSDQVDPEILLIQSLLSDQRPRRRWRWAAGDDERTRATLDRPHATALLGTLATLTPVARLVVGLHEIAGWSPDEIAERLGALVAEQSPADTLAHFRADAACAIELVPADADADLLLRLDRWMDGQLSEEAALDLRRAVLELPATRALRDGMIAIRALLPRAIPALFAAMPSPALTERLLKLMQSQPRSARSKTTSRRAQGLLALGVLALTTAIILLPTLLARPTAPIAAHTSTVADMIDAAIHRFDRAPLQTGVLHEQYRVERGNRPAFVIDRWYDYAAPNRLAISLQQEGQKEAPLMQISSDGHSLVQFRNAFDNQSQQRAVDAHITAEQARAILPLLRGQPLAQPFARGLGPNNPGDLGPLYLAQARAASAAFLGQTTMLGRTAFLLTYHTENASVLPARQAAMQPAQVLLTIDSQTYALLDVALIPDGAAESSAQHPLQAQVLEVLDNVPDDRFTLPSSADVVQRVGLASVRLPDIPANQIMSLDDAARRTTSALLAPQLLPDSAMRGLAFTARTNGTGQDVVLLYEGEFQNVVLLPGNGYNENGQAAGEERSVGDFRYRIVRGFGADGGLSAMVYRADTPDQRLLMILDDEYATTDEREATLERMIASLTPVNAQSLPELRRNFQASGEIQGQS